MRDTLKLFVLILLSLLTFSKHTVAAETDCSKMPPIEELRYWNHSEKEPITIPIKGGGKIDGLAYLFIPKSQTGDVLSVLAVLVQVKGDVWLFTLGLIEKGKSVPTLCNKKQIVTWADDML